jgi:hypothetical protein
MSNFPQHLSHYVVRFYRGRYGLSEFIHEIKDELDDEMWFSLTPHEVAKAHSRAFQRCPDVLLVLDSFCGIGGDCGYMPPDIFTIGCDIVQTRLALAREFTSRHGKGRCDFVMSDSMKGRSCFRPASFDAVYLSPPWGHDGVRNRNRAPIFGERSLTSMSVDGWEAFKRAWRLTKRDNIAYFLPRGMREDELISLAESYTARGKLHVEVHESFDPDDETATPNQKYKVRAITAYYGEIEHNSSPEPS